MKDESGETSDTSSAQTLRRGLSILKLLARYQTVGLGVSEIARRLDLSKATTVRLTRTLTDECFVEQDGETRRYRLGPEAFAVGLAVESNYALQRAAAPALQALARETGDWVFFTVRHNLEAICLSRESGNARYPQASLRVGDRHPLGLGAGGMAILSAMQKDEAEAVLRLNAPAIVRQYPAMTIEALHQLLEETREAGYAFIPGLIVPGYWGIGVPISGSDSRPVAAIVLIASAARLDGSRLAIIRARLKDLARDLANLQSLESEADTAGIPPKRQNAKR